MSGPVSGGLGVAGGCPPSPLPAAHGPPFAAPRLIDDDRAADGYPRLTLTNDFVSVTLAPNAGARSFAFSLRLGACGAPKNVFTSVGALRDDVAIQPPLSTTDRIGTYTRSFPAGMFNRPYSVGQRATAADAVSATLSYDAPDVVPNGAHFERTLSLEAAEPGFTVAQHVTFGPGAAEQRAVRYDSFDTSGAALVLDDRADGAVGIFYPDVSCICVAIVAWPIADVEDARLIPEKTSTVVRLQFAPDRTTRTRYTLYRVAGIDEAWAMMFRERIAVAAKR